MLDVPLYGRIAALQLFRPAGEPRDLLLLLTERNQFCVLAYDEAAGAPGSVGLGCWELLHACACRCSVGRRRRAALHPPVPAARDPPSTCCCPLSAAALQASW